MKLTLPYWIFVTSRKVWGRLGYLVFSCCKSTSARSNSDSVLSISDNGSLMKDQDVRTGDLPLTCSVILSFQENTAASSLLMTSRALCSDFRLSELTISSAEFVSAVKTLYSSSPRLAFPDLIHEKKNIIMTNSTRSTRSKRKNLLLFPLKLLCGTSYKVCSSILYRKRTI